MTVYDAKGQDVALTYYFQKAATDTWNVYVTANGTAGRRRRAPAPAAGRRRSRSRANGGAPTAPAGAGDARHPGHDQRRRRRRRCRSPACSSTSTGATQFGAGFGVTDLTQDGYAPGQLTGIRSRATASSWRATPTASRKPAGQIELAELPQPAGPAAAGRQRLGAHLRLGRPGRRRAGRRQPRRAAGRRAGRSNVDLTGELVNMITAQRVYQANAQTIKTQDQVLQTLVNLR